mmetsp:Transcript_44387/g.135294  ORF Transcript_44387/g.135294 Transcript_44387/m.135294 type:complete len:285 (-) Transcript_44387:483-1337(-)
MFSVVTTELSDCYQNYNGNHKQNHQHCSNNSPVRKATFELLQDVRTAYSPSDHRRAWQGNRFHCPLSLVAIHFVLQLLVFKCKSLVLLPLHLQISIVIDHLCCWDSNGVRSFGRECCQIASVTHRRVVQIIWCGCIAQYLLTNHGHGSHFFYCACRVSPASQAKIFQLGSTVCHPWNGHGRSAYGHSPWQVTRWQCACLRLVKTLVVTYPGHGTRLGSILLALLFQIVPPPSLHVPFPMLPHPLLLLLFPMHACLSPRICFGFVLFFPGQMSGILKVVTRLRFQ